MIASDESRTLVGESMVSEDFSKLHVNSLICCALLAHSARKLSMSSSFSYSMLSTSAKVSKPGIGR